MSFAGCISSRCLCREEDGRGLIRLADNAYSSLTDEERSQLTDELYGGSGETETETPEMIHRKLKDLDRELDLLHKDRKKYYIRAIAIEQQHMTLVQQQQQQDGGDTMEPYVGSQNFRLQFLRAELLDARAAARRLVEFFQHKFELFGEAKLASKIRHSDLNDNEKEALVSGVMTYTGVSDSAGRPVLLFRRANMFYFPVVSIRRIFIYIFQKIVEENELAQKKGFILIAYHMNMPFLMNPSVVTLYFPALRMIKNGIPVRNAATHVYYKDLKEHFVLNLSLVLLSKKQRARFLAHFKHSHEDCALDAIEYGVNFDQLPLTDEGNLQYYKICSYWDSQMQLEESN